MNLVTFNDLFHKALIAGCEDLAGINSQNFSKLMAPKLDTSPLFIHDVGGEQWHTDDYPHCFDKHDIPLFPFPSFRASLDNTDGMQATRINLHVFIHEIKAPPHCGRGYFFMASFKWWEFLPGMAKAVLNNNMVPEHMVKAFTDPALRIGTKIREAEDEIFIGTRHPTAQGNGHTGRLLFWTAKDKSRVVDVESTNGEYRKIFTDRYRLIHEVVSKFCIDWMNPHLFTVKVSPKKEGKSVQWIEQRSHYTLVHKSHPINRTGAVSTVATSGAESHLHRIAHARRAHFRLLKHPKFKRKVGQRILIRAAWVGPKEWEDGSGQIYKLVERPNPALN